jgi:rRNA maturation protein Rpf1
MPDSCNACGFFECDRGADARFDAFGMGITRGGGLDGNENGYWVIGVNLRKRAEWPRNEQRLPISPGVATDQRSDKNMDQKVRAVRDPGRHRRQQTQVLKK